MSGGSVGEDLHLPVRPDRPQPTQQLGNLDRVIDGDLGSRSNGQ